MFGFGGIRRTFGAATVVMGGVLALVPVPTPAAQAASACVGSPGVVVADGATWTRHRMVDLRVSVPPGASGVEIANRADFADAQLRPLSPACTYGWRLTAGSLDPMRTVFVRFPGAADPAAAAHDRIWLDQERPVIVRADARWRNRRHGWVLTVRAVDLGAGPGWFQTSRTTGKVRRSYPDRRTVVTWDRSVIERVRYFDRLGNRTGWVRVRFV